MKDLIAYMKELQIQMGLESRKLVVESFADTVVNTQMMDIYSDLSR